MSATHDELVIVNVTTGAPPVDRLGFGEVLTLSEGAAFAGGLRVRSYQTKDAVNADSDLTAAEKAAGVAFFDTDGHGKTWKIGRTTQTATDYDNAATHLTAIRAEDDAWYGLTCLSRAESVLNAIAAWAVGEGKLYVAQSSDSAFADGTGGNVGEDFQTAAYAESGLLFHDTDAEHLDIRNLASFLGADPDFQSTIAALRTFSGLTPSDITDTQEGNIKGYDASIYLPFRGVNVVAPNKLADGNFWDVRLVKDWANARIGEATAQTLINQSAYNSKVGFTDIGLEMLAKGVRGVLTKGVRVGHFTAGSVDVTPPKRADFTSGQIASRAATLTGKAELAGAVQSVTWNVAVIIA